MSQRYAFSQALALESASDLPRDYKTGDYVLPPDILEYYAKLIAYKVAYNLGNGFVMNSDDDLLTYIDCGDEE